MGTNALASSASTALFNIAIGNNAMADGHTTNTTGDDNIALGNEALDGLLGGDNNIGIGEEALHSNFGGAAALAGDDNIGIGRSTLSLLSSGSNNIAIGENAINSSGSTNITGSNNIGIGQDALGDLSTASNLIAIGQNALDAVTTSAATKNIAIGTNAGGAITTGDDVIAIGDGAGSSVTTSVRNVYIGTDAGSSITTVSNFGHVMIGWQSAQNSTSGDGSVFIGKSTGKQVLGNNNIAIGVSAMASGLNNVNSIDNIGIGRSALSTGGSGVDQGNIGIGSSTMSSIGGALQNIGIGTNALTSLTTGDYNVMLGVEAGGILTDGSNNLFIGSWAGSQQSTGVSDTFILDNFTQGRNSEAEELTDSLIVGTFNATPASQTLVFNVGSVTIDTNMVIAGGSITDVSGAISFGDENILTTGTFGAGAITGTSITDGVATLSGGNLTSMGNITGSDVDIETGTGNYNSQGTIFSEVTNGNSISGKSANSIGIRGESLASHAGFFVRDASGTTGAVLQVSLLAFGDTEDIFGASGPLGDFFTIGFAGQVDVVGPLVMTAAGKINLRDSAVGIYSQADTFLDLFADGGVRIGDSSAGAPTNHTAFSPTGNITQAGTAITTLDQLYLNETTTPTPVVDDGAIYTTSDNELFFQDGDGTEHLLHGDAFSNIWFHALTSVEVTISTQDAYTVIDSFTVVGHEDDLLNVVGNADANTLTLSAIAGGEYQISYHGSITATGGADKEMSFCLGIIFATPKDITNVTDDTITPIVITSTAHGLENGDMVEIVGVLGNTAANGSFIVNNKADDTFEIAALDGSATTGNGNYNEGSPTGDITIEYPGNMEIHRMVRGADFGAISATGLHVLADSDVLSLYVANLSGVTNLTVSSISLSVFRIGD